MVSLFSVRQIVNSTSSDVNGLPLENLTSSRSLNSQVRSSRFFHEDASAGTSFMSASRPISEL
ncbi:Uncharacterised protein [Bordetella pertussis]|nr:Uncharacterised protein [Bordetella pertussis]CFU86466.1 Uncharacterised protein [Bordetella pertussis]CPI26678.1 Uncharacterised protein [Bordetella pertussis]CPL01001.1 Uncharacterised protein [Bordetella pertussis]CPM19238.1 Uncharacterised protein [Bordetella pertussis]